MAIDELKIIWNNGGNTVDLNTDPYRISNEGYIPAVSRRSNSLMGGSVYADVVETISLSLTGTKSEIKDGLTELMQAFDEASRWALGDPTVASPVLLQWYSPDASTYFNATIKGPVEGDWAVMPGNYRALLDSGFVQSVTLRFRRTPFTRFVDDYTSAAAATMPTVLTMTRSAAVQHFSPLGAYFYKGTGTETLDLSAGWLLFSSGPSTGTVPMRIIEGEDFALPTTNFSSVADTSSLASGDDVLRFTPPDTAEYTIGHTLASVWDVKSAFVYAVVRNNSTTRTYTMQMTTLTRSVSGVSGPRVVIDPSDGFNYPAPVYLGQIHNRNGLQTISLTVSVDSVAGSGTLDIDYFVLQRSDDGTAYALYFTDQSGLVPAPVGVDPNTNDKIAPEVYRTLWTSPSVRVMMNYEGNASLHVKGDRVYGMLLGSSPPAWRPTITPGGSLAELQLIESGLYLTTLVPR